MAIWAAFCLCCCQSFAAAAAAVSVAVAAGVAVAAFSKLHEMLLVGSQRGFDYKTVCCCQLTFVFVCVWSRLVVCLDNSATIV